MPSQNNPDNTANGLLSNFTNNNGTGKQKQKNMQTLTLDHVSPATRLLEKRRQMFEVQEAFDSQKEEFARREDAFRRREEALRRKDLELQESLIKFNKFLQENESKRTRAVKRAQDEKRQREQKDVEILKLKKLLDKKNQDERLMKEKKDANMKFQTYLAGVVEYASKDFAEIVDLLNRYDTLKLAHSDLKTRQQEYETENDKLTITYANTSKERANEILHTSNEISKLRTQSDQATIGVKKVQDEVDFAIEQMSTKTKDLGQILGSVDNLLERCEQGLRSKVIKKKKKDTTKLSLEEESDIAYNQLDDIAIYMTDFQDTCKEYNDEIRKNAMATTGGYEEY